MKKLSRIRQIFCMILFGATTAVSAWFLARDIKLAVCHQNFEATITRIEFQKRYKSSGTYKIYVEYFVLENIHYLKCKRLYFFKQFNCAAHKKT